MKITLIITIVILFVLAIGLFVKYKISTVQDKYDLAGSLDREVDKLFKDKHSHAMAIGVVKDGLTYHKAYGVLNKDSPESPNAQTVFQVGSITKVFTASLLQVLSDKGIVSIDATLKELIGISPVARLLVR